jgi:hypothetical protein
MAPKVEKGGAGSLERMFAAAPAAAATRLSAAAGTPPTASTLRLGERTGTERLVPSPQRETQFSPAAQEMKERGGTKQQKGLPPSKRARSAPQQQQQQQQQQQASPKDQKGSIFKFFSPKSSKGEAPPPP